MITLQNASVFQCLFIFLIELDAVRAVEMKLFNGRSSLGSITEHQQGAGAQREPEL